MEYAYNPGAALITIFFITVMVFKYLQGYRRTLSADSSYMPIFILMTLISVFAFTEYDTYHYHTTYDLMVEYNEAEHVEDYYFWLTQILPNSYYLWRFFIWGGACLFFVWALKLLKLNPTICGALIPLVLIARFNVSRASFGIVVLLFCIILLIAPKKNLLTRLLALAGVVASGYLHSSMIIFIIIALLFLILPLTKKSIIILLLLFPFLYGSVLLISENLLDTYGLVNENRIFKYMMEDKLEFSTIGLFIKCVEKATLLLIVYSISRYYLSEQIKAKPENLIFFRIYKIAFGFIYVSSLFFLQNVSDWVSTRTTDAGLFFLIICIIHYFSNNRKTMIDKLYIRMSMGLLYFGQFYFIYDVISSQ